MVLATVSGDGRPRARTVLLKSHDAGGFTFYTNRTSRKATDLAAVPRACLLFPWHAMQRQVIISGTVTALSTEQSEPYFRTRPRGSQLGAWTSRQSSVIASRDELDERYAAARAPVAGGHAGADAGILGRVPGCTRHVRVLAGAAEPAARPVPLPAGRR